MFKFFSGFVGDVTQVYKGLPQAAGRRLAYAC